MKAAIGKRLSDIEEEILSEAFKTKMNNAWSRYSGSLERVQWEVKYKTLYKNRAIGKLSEVKYQELMGGEPKTFVFEGQTRKVDNLIGTTAKEIKSGKLKRSDFIEQQLRKDIEMLRRSNVPVDKIEWHLFDGADDDMINALETLRGTYGKDKFDFIDYNNL